MEDNELIYQIALPLLPEVGLHWSKALVWHFGSAGAVFRATKQELLALPHMGERTADALISGRERALERARKEALFIEQHQIKTYWFEDDDYPARLRELPDAPTMIYTMGNIRFEGHWVAIVGTRTPTDRGVQLCHDLVTDLARKLQDITIVSGLAYGIDICAHKAALEAGIPTIIVPAHGLDRIYPAAHRQTAVKALEQGGILTEYMSETQPEKQNFVARNRIVAGLTEATVVIESKDRGGSLITAGLANDYGRDVFAFPGRPSDEIARGCNELIRKNRAALICSADDLIYAMGWEQKNTRQTSLAETLFAQLSAEEEAVMNALRQEEDGMHVNAIAEASGLSFPETSSILFGLELKDLVRALPGSRYRAS